MAGLIVGSVFFAAVAGLLYATSLYLQFGHGLTPLPAAAVMAPARHGMLLRIGVRRGTRRCPARAGRKRERHLNAGQQIANATGAALISTAYLAVASTGTASQAVTASLVTVLVLTALSLLAVPLLPRRAAAAAR